MRKSTVCSATRIGTEHLISRVDIDSRVSVRVGVVGGGAGRPRAGYERLPLVCFAVIALSMTLCSARATAERAEPHALALPSPEHRPSPDIVPLHDGDEMGVKSWAVKKATKALAKGIRAGGRIFHQLIGELDAKAATFFRKHSNRIADELESIATIPDLTIIIVTEKISYFMTSILKANPGTAKVIEKSLEGLLWFLL